MQLGNNLQNSATPSSVLKEAKEADIRSDGQGVSLSNSGSDTRFQLQLWGFPLKCYVAAKAKTFFSLSRVDSLGSNDHYPPMPSCLGNPLLSLGSYPHQEDLLQKYPSQGAGKYTGCENSY